MRRVVTVSLNGNSYQVEEGGYESLTTYLAQSAERLADNPDKAEIVSDLEQAIAEKLGRFLGPHKNVVSAEEVAQVIGEMGPVDGSASGTSGASAETAEGAGSSQSSEPHGQKSGSGATRRLYQIREGAMVSGVCNGLAAYFDIDVTIVRVVFVALAIITYGAWILAYIVMMFVIPYAQTGEQHAAAHGWPFNAEELVARAKQNYAQFREGKHWRRQSREQRRMWREQRRAARAQWRHWQPGAPPSPGWEGRAADMSYAAQILGGTLMPLVALFHAVLLIGLFFAIASLLTRHAILGWQLPTDVPVWAAVIGLLLLYQVIASPIRYAHFAGAHHTYYGRGVFALWGALVWMAFLVFAAWMAWWHWPELQQFLHQTWRQLHDVTAQLTRAVREITS
jgi:phage shock protein PspC (stress-responsive transcriptional regulator)